MRPAPTQTTWLSPHSCSPSTLMRRSTRSLIACASSEASLSVVNDAHSGFCPALSTLRYEIKYLGMEDQPPSDRSEEHTSELQSRLHLVCRLLLEKKKKEQNVHAAGAAQAHYARVG